MRQPAIAPEIVEEPKDLEEVRLSDLPQLTYFERDAGSYITAGVFLADEPDSGVPNLSFHRAQVISDKELRIRLGSSHHLTQYQTKSESRGEALEAAILIGPPPPSCSRPPRQSHTTKASLRLQAKSKVRRLKMRRCRTVSLAVPADTEIVIEGRILPHERRPEGPFGEFMGSLRPGRRQPCFRNHRCGGAQETRSITD